MKEWVFEILFSATLNRHPYYNFLFSVTFYRRDSIEYTLFTVLYIEFS